MTLSIAQRPLRHLGLLALAALAVAFALCAFPVRALAAAEVPSEPIASARELADALNAGAPEGEPVAEVSADGSTVTLLGPVELEGASALQIAVPEGQILALDLASFDLTLENGGTAAPAQLAVTGAGAFTIGATGGSIVSRTQDGTVASLSVAAGTVSLNAPLAIETTVDGVGAVSVSGGALSVGEGASITGSKTGERAFVRVAGGTFDLLGKIVCTGDEDSAAFGVVGGEATLRGGSITAAGGRSGFGVVVQGEGICTINGTEVEGGAEADFGGTLAIAGGHVEGSVGAFEDSTVTVTVDEETGMSASFGYPVEVGYLQGVGAVEYEFGLEVDTTYFRYFATAEAAAADAAAYPTVNWATVSEDAYICMNAFADNGAAATAYYNNFYESIDDPMRLHFDGPVMMDFVVIRPGIGFTFTYRDASGAVVYQESIPVDALNPESSIVAPYFDASLPGTPATANAEVGVGDYTLEITALDDPSTVYSRSQIAISKVTIDPNGGTYESDYATVKYLMQGSWAMAEVPVRPDYALTSWTSAPVAGMVTWNADEGAWRWITPKTAGTFAFTAQWSPEVVAVSRLWNPSNGAHLLTTDANEVRVLTTRFGWRDEGEVFSEYGYAAPGSTPVTRLYNPNNGDHLFTASDAEVRALMGIGWRDEGVRFYGSPDAAHPVYRLWNSHQTADGGLGSHLWTADENEYRTLPLLPPVGAWQQEGVAWNAVSVPSTN